MTITIRATELGPEGVTDFAFDPNNPAVYTTGAFTFDMAYLTGTSAVSNVVTEEQRFDGNGLPYSVWRWVSEFSWTLTRYNIVRDGAVVSWADIDPIIGSRSDEGVFLYDPTPDIPTEYATSSLIGPVVAGQAYDYLGSSGQDSFYASVLGGGVARGLGGNDMLYGGAGNDFLSGGDGDDVIYGGGGRDVAYGGGGDDAMYQDTVGSARFFGGSGEDVLWGYVGQDHLDGGYGDDLLYGYDGNDVLEGGPGGDSLFGGDGIDTVSFRTAQSGVVMYLDGRRAQTGDARGDVYNSIENIDGSGFDDRLVGNHLSNLIRGGGGADSLEGGSGADQIYGDGGNDMLTGGADFDRFYFTGAFGHDTITDYDQGPGRDQMRFLAMEEAFDSYAEIAALTTQVGNDVVIALDADRSITLLDLSLSELDASDFFFWPR